MNASFSEPALNTDPRIAAGLTRRNKQSRYVKRKAEARSSNHCCSEIAIIFTNSDYVFIALGIQHAVRMRHIVICGLAGSKSFYHISHKRHGLKKTYWK
jgi:hypothetical protein